MTMQHATLSARKTQTKKAVVGSAPALTVEEDQPAPQGPKAAKAAYCSLRLEMQNAHLDLKLGVRRGTSRPGTRPVLRQSEPADPGKTGQIDSHKEKDNARETQEHSWS